MFRMTNFAIIVGSLSLFACSSISIPSHGGLQSPYVSSYKKGLESSFVVPEASAIQKAGQTKEYSKPFEEVTEAYLNVLSQYQGIIAMNSSSSQLSMLVMKAREYKLAPENRTRIATYGSFFEQWLAITVTKMPDSDVTEVAVAIYKPTGDLINSDAAAHLLFTQIQIQLYNRMLWRDKFVFEKQPPLKNKSKTGEEASVAPVATSSYRHQELEQLLGGWIYKSLKEELFTVYSPEVTSWLNGIVDKLKKSAGVPDLKTQVIIIPANGVNAFALPNGNIIVSSGLLDSLENAGQVAAVLAHELDHLIQHDTIVLFKTKQAGGAGASVVRLVTSIGNFAVGIISSVTPAGPLIGALMDLGRAAGTQLLEKGAQHLETELVSNFSAEVELRADTNGINMLDKAGFDPETNIAMLNTLQKFQDKSLEKDEVVMFNLVNIKPGIDERINNLKKVLKEIKK